MKAVINFVGEGISSCYFTISQFRINKKYFPLIMVFFFFHCATESKKTEYEVVKRVDSFMGKSIKDSDITIHSHKEKGLISISGNRDRFLFLLPYSEDWTVKYTDNSLIKLKSNAKDLIASITSETSETKVEPEKFLLDLKNRIELRIGVKLQRVKILSSPSNKILTYFFEIEQSGVKLRSHNFWSIRQRPDNVILKLHLSAIDLSLEDMDNIEKILPIFMDTGFRVLTDEDFK